MLRLLMRTWDSICRLPGLMLLVADDAALARQEPRRFRFAWLSLLGVSLAWGGASVAVWATAWKLFGDISALLVMPSLAVTVLAVLGPGRLMFNSLARRLGGRRVVLRSLAGTILACTIGCALLAIKPETYTPENRWPDLLAWLRPAHKMYRVMWLMPLWGAWAMLILPQFRKPDDRTEPSVAALAGGFGPLSAAACMGAILAVTILYFGFMPWTQLTISLAAITAAVAGGMVFCAMEGGLSRRALLSTNLLTQIVFVLAYVANR